MAAKKKKAFCAVTQGKTSEKEYDAIVKDACERLGWAFPEKEGMVLPVEIPDGAPSYFISKKRGVRRAFRHDYYWADKKLALEMDGISPHGIRNRHQSFVGFTRDCEKHRAMALLGITLLRYTPAQLRAGQLYEDLCFIEGNKR